MHHIRWKSIEEIDIKMINNKFEHTTSTIFFKKKQTTWFVIYYFWISLCNLIQFRNNDWHLIRQSHRRQRLIEIYSSNATNLFGHNFIYNSIDLFTWNKKKSLFSISRKRSYYSMKHANSRLFVVVSATTPSRSIALQYFSLKKKILNVFEHKKINRFDSTGIHG